MHVIKRKTLVEFYQQPGHQDAKGALEAWYYEAKHAQWASPADIKALYRSASILRDNRVVFNIAGNKYRLIVSVDYVRQACFVKFIGTHEQYDAIDAEVYDVYSTH